MKVCINFSPELITIGSRWVGVGREEAKASQLVNTRGPELPTDGPDHTTGHHSGQEFQADNAKLVRSTECVGHGFTRL